MHNDAPLWKDRGFLSRFVEARAWMFVVAIVSVEALVCPGKSRADVVLTSGEHKLSSTPILVANGSTVASTPNDFVVVWHERDYDVDTSKVVGQRYSTTGLPVGSQFEVVVAGTEEPASPAIATTGEDGSFVVVWNAYTLTTNRVLGQRFDGSAAKLGAVFQVSSGTSSSHSAVSAAADGSFVVAWIASTETTTAIKGRRYDSAGVASFPPKELAAPADEYFNRFALSSALNGDFVVAWSSGNHVDYLPFFRQHAISGKLFDAEGAEVTPLSLVQSQGAQRRDGLGIVHKSDGSFVVVFSDGYYTDVLPPGPFDVFGTTFNSDGTPLLDQIPISVRDSSEDEGLNLDASTTSDGGFVVVWTALDYSTMTDIRVDGREVDSTGAPSGSEFLVTRGLADYPLRPSVGKTGGELLITWEEALNAVVARSARSVNPLVCGDGTLDGTITSTDALLALQAAIELVFCSVVVCDVDAVPGVTASDALHILRVAVGFNEALNCPTG